MSEEEPEEVTEPARETPVSVQRIPFGIMALIQLALAAFVLVCANYLSGTNHRTWDLTQNRDFSLSSLTENLLESSTIQNRTNPVRVIMLVARTSPHYSRLRAVLEEYDRKGGDGLEVEFVDPVHDTDRALELTDTYGQIITEEFFIVDASPGNGDAEEAGAPTKVAASHIRFIPLNEMLVHRNDTRGIRRLMGYQDEDLISTAILSAVEGSPRVVYFLADKSQLQDSSENTPWAVLRRHLQRQNILLQPLRISEMDAIPENAEGVAIVAPEYDLDEREMQIVQDYWLRPGAALLVILDPLYRPRNLQSFLRQHGVRMRDDRIITVRNGQRISEVPVTFTFAPELNRINAELRGKATTFDGVSASLEVEENADRLVNRRILPVPLIEASPKFWGETKYIEENPDFDPVEDTRPPLYLAAAVTRGNPGENEALPQTSRMVVISNAAFLNPQNQYREQRDFLGNSAHWLLGREELMGIGPLPVRNYKLNLIDSEVAFVNRFNLFIVPGIFLFIALIVARARRS